MNTMYSNQEPSPVNPAMQTEADNEKFLGRIVLLLTAITYLATLRFEFVHNDAEQIVFNPFVKAWRYVPEYFVSPLWKQVSPLTPGNYYRPLFLLFIRLNYAIFTNRSLGWHFVALSLHLVVTWLAFVLVKKLTGRLSLAWMTALIFGVHPVHHEVVAWVSGATESLFAALFLEAFLAYLQSREKARAAWMAGSCVLYAAALLCKETAIVLPALVFAHGWFASGSTTETGKGFEFSARFRRAVMPTLPYVPVAIAYLIVRQLVFSGSGQSVSNESWSTWLLTLPSLLVFYVQHWFFPVRLAEFYDVYYKQNFGVAQVLLPLVVLLALGGAVWALRRRLGVSEVGNAVAWIIVPLLPALCTFVFRPDELVHDRYFYVPSIGAALLVALFIERIAATNPGPFGQPVHVLAAGLSLAVVLAFLAVPATAPWASNLALYARAHEVAPLNPTATNNLASELMSGGQLDKAQALLEDGYRQHDDDFRIAFNLGRAEYARHDYQNAEVYTRRAIALAPAFPDSYVTLGQIELKHDDPADAEKSLRRAVELGPYNAPFHTSYGIVLALNGDCAGATRQFETSLALNPGDIVTTTQLLRCRGTLPGNPPTTTKIGQL